MALAITLKLIAFQFHKLYFSSVVEGYLYFLHLQAIHHETKYRNKHKTSIPLPVYQQHLQIFDIQECFCFISDYFNVITKGAVYEKLEKVDEGDVDDGKAEDAEDGGDVDDDEQDTDEHEDGHEDEGDGDGDGGNSDVDDDDDEIPPLRKRLRAAKVIDVKKYVF